MCIGALTDFGPLIARPSTFLIGAIGGQLGIFTSFGLAILAGKIIPGLEPFTLKQAASIGIIGSSDGPTTIFLASKLAPQILPIVAVAAYSYMALVPLIQPPIMRLLTTKKERVIVMQEAKPVSQRKKILFPIGMTIVTILFIPGAGELIACMMLGNLIRECGILERYNKTLQNDFLNILTLILALSIGSTCSAETILNMKTVVIIVLGLLAFAMGTTGGILFAKLLCVISGGKVNPLIGNAGISAMPMAARVTQKVGQEYNQYNHLLMHAMGPLTASTIGSALVAGIFLAFLA
jgi:oxaloacetate decarboxylase beta subunit